VAEHGFKIQTAIAAIAPVLAQQLSPIHLAGDNMVVVATPTLAKGRGEKILSLMRGQAKKKPLS
jgi:hypothetical protein